MSKLCVICGHTERDKAGKCVERWGEGAWAVYCDCWCEEEWPLERDPSDD